MASPMNEPLSAIADEVLVTGESVALATGSRTIMRLAKNTTAGAGCVGSIAMGADAAGGTCSVVIAGYAQCLAAAPIPAQTAITSSANGRWQVAASGQIVHGYSLTAATADGDTFEAILNTADSGRTVA